MTDIAFDRRPRPKASLRELAKYTAIATLPLIGAACLYLISQHIPKPAPAMAGFAIKVEMPDAHGSGVHIGHGLVLTNNHVIANETDIAILGDDGSSRAAKVLWSNADLDVALLQSDDGAGLRTVEIDCRHLVVGEAITSYGNPEDADFITMRGSIAGSERKVNGAADIVMPVDSALISGMSGGPVLDANGKLVGLNDAFESTEIYNNPMEAPTKSWTGLGYIIPSSAFCPLLGRGA